MALEPVVVTQSRVSDGTVQDEELDDHPLKVLLDHPNPTFSRMQLLRIVSLWLSQVGDAYLLKVVDGMGVPRELHPLSPANMEMRVGPTGIEGYVFNAESGQRTAYTPEEIIRIFNPDPACAFEGVGNLGPQAVSYDTDLFLNQTLRKHYKDDATPKTVITSSEDAQLPKKDSKDRWETEWLNRYSRRTGGQTGLPAWLPPGFDLKVLEGLQLKDLVPLLEYLRDKILSANGVPGSIVGLDRNINRATAQAGVHIFEKNVIEPQSSLIADALTNQLARDFEGIRRISGSPPRPIKRERLTLKRNT
jgi:phage portal protein BeeE